MLTLDQQRRMQCAAQLFLQCAVDPTEPRADPEQHEAELALLEVERYRNHARRGRGSEPSRRSKLARAERPPSRPQLPHAASLVHQQAARPRARISLPFRLFALTLRSVHREVAARDPELGKLADQNLRKLLDIVSGVQ